MMIAATIYTERYEAAAAKTLMLITYAQTQIIMWVKILAGLFTLLIIGIYHALFLLWFHHRFDALLAPRAAFVELAAVADAPVIAAKVAQAMLVQAAAALCFAAGPAVHTGSPSVTHLRPPQSRLTHLLFESAGHPLFLHSVTARLYYGKTPYTLGDDIFDRS